MTFKIGIEDLVANALIEDPEEKFISYSKIENYGAKVVNFLNKQQKDDAILVFSRDRTNRMLRDYSNFFEEINLENELGIKLRDGIKQEELINAFRGYLTFSLLQAYVASYKSIKI